MSRALQPAIQSCDTGQRILFLTAVDQLTITWIFHKDVHYQVKHRLYMPSTPSQ